MNQDIRTKMEGLILYLLEAVPERKQKKIPFEETIGLITTRWYGICLKLNPNFVITAFILLYNAKSQNIPWYQPHIESRVLYDLKRYLINHPEDNTASFTYLMQCYENAVPLDVVFSYLSPDLQNRVGITFRMLGSLAASLSSDVDKRVFNYVMTSKTPAPRLLGSPSSPTSAMRDFIS